MVGTSVQHVTVQRIHQRRTHPLCALGLTVSFFRIQHVLWHRFAEVGASVVRLEAHPTPLSSAGTCHMVTRHFVRDVGTIFALRALLAPAPVKSENDNETRSYIHRAKFMIIAMSHREIRCNKILIFCLWFLPLLTFVQGAPPQHLLLPVLPTFQRKCTAPVHDLMTYTCSHEHKKLQCTGRCRRQVVQPTLLATLQTH